MVKIVQKFNAKRPVLMVVYVIWLRVNVNVLAITLEMIVYQFIVKIYQNGGTCDTTKGECKCIGNYFGMIVYQLTVQIITIMEVLVILLKANVNVLAITLAMIVYQLTVLIIAKMVVIVIQL